MFGKALSLATLVTLLVAAQISRADLAPVVVLSLKPGTVLSGRDDLSKKSCRVLITENSGRSMRVVLTLGAEVYPEIGLDKAWTPGALFYGKYSSTEKQTEDGAPYLTEEQAFLTEGFFLGHIRFRVFNIDTGDKVYEMHDSHIECSNLAIIKPHQGRK